MRLIVGILSGLLLTPLLAILWIALGRPPVAVTDEPFAGVDRVAQFALERRLKSDGLREPPIREDEGNLVAGAQLYREQCAVCHGRHGKPAPLGARLAPAAPPLWEVRRAGANPAIGVSGEPPGWIFWRISNGVRYSGMPSFQKLLSEAEIWQMSLLLASANKPLPPGALDVLLASEPPPSGAAEEKSSPRPIH